MPDKVPALTDPPEGYADWLANLRARIHAAQQRAALAVNTGLLRLYWQIGRDILDRQAGSGGANLMYVRAFAEAWPEECRGSLRHHATGPRPGPGRRVRPQVAGLSGGRSLTKSRGSPPG